MNKRAIVNVATGDFYCKMQERLWESFIDNTDVCHITTKDSSFKEYGRVNNNGIDLLLWTDCLPTGSRPHSESPYGFKVHAIKAACEMGYTSILWLDSPAHAVKEDISPIFDKIEKEGYYAMSHIDPLENYVGDKALVSFGMYRHNLIGLNLPSGSCYGFDLTTIGNHLFHRLVSAEENLLFSDVGSHRHDEAILALILKSADLPVFTFDPLFQSDSPECVIKSGGQ